MPNDDVKNGVALIFRRKAKDLLTDREFVFSASMDLRWFSYSDAMKFLELALSEGLLKRDGKAITPTFDYRKLELPAAFRPSPELVKARIPAGAGPPPRDTLFMRLVDEIAKKTGQDRTSVIARINKKREELGLDAEVLALLLAAEVGLEVSSHLDAAEKLVKERIAQRMDERVRDEKGEEE